MQERVVNVGGNGIGFGGMLAILFIGLKLTGYVTWSWWWVLSPLWIPFIVVLILLIFILIGVGVCMLLDCISRRRK
jgi:hypothetical protein